MKTANAIKKLEKNGYTIKGKVAGFVRAVKPGAKEIAFIDQDGDAINFCHYENDYCFNNLKRALEMSL